MDYVIYLAYEWIILGLGPQLCITWIWMRPTGVWMVSVDRDHAFWGQYLLQLHTMSGYSTVVSGVPTMDFCCVILGLSPQLCITWILMRPACVSMASVDRDHDFWGQHLLRLGTKLGYSTVVSRVPCVWVSCCAARLEGEDCSIIAPYSSNDSREVFLGF